MATRLYAIAVIVAGCAAPAGRPATIDVGSATITLEVAPGRLDVSRATIEAWIGAAATATVRYYGRFPVPRYRVIVVPVPGAAGVLSGTSWGEGGARTRILVGEHVTAAQLADDWVMTHEMVHSALPRLADEHHWLEEGLATYVEPLARSWAGSYPATQVWADLVGGLPKGLPKLGDRGLDRTPTWGRTYWGGAQFCLIADIEIRKRTRGRRGLVDALRGIVAAGGNIEQAWPIERVLRTGDTAVGVSVLEDLYRDMKDTSKAPDLDRLWVELGVSLRDGDVVFDDTAPHAAVRRAITARP